jgi:D-amino-acid dehydrogenase
MDARPKDWIQSTSAHPAHPVTKDSSLSPNIHVAVVGAGIIGLAVAYHLMKDGAQVTLVDRDPEGDNAAVGSAGGIAVTEVMPASAPGSLWRVFGWMVDPLGPLTVRPAHAPKLIPWLSRFAQAGTQSEVERISKTLAALNSRVYDDLLPMFTATGLAGELNRNGALSVYESEAGYRRDAAEWACKRFHGIEIQELTGAQARQMEPALGPRVHRAVFTPQWSQVNDPRRVVQGLREWLASRGVAIQRGEVSDIVSNHAGTPVRIILPDGKHIEADKAVVAAGAWSGILARRLGDPALVESERGYNTTFPDPGIVLHRELIFAERKFVAASLSCGLRIGGAAEFGGLGAAPNFKRSRALLELARLYLPSLRTEGGTVWAGHRPTTPDSLPVIGRARRLENVFYAFGHGHLGLTQAATTGRLVSELVFSRPTSIDVTPLGIGRFS